MKMSEKKDCLEKIGENMDRLITINLGMRRGIEQYYSAARERQGGRPLALMTAEKLREAIKPGDTVVIATGMIGSYMKRYPRIGETDGPVGAAALARALQLGLGAKPILVTDEALLDMVSATCRGAEFNIVPKELLKELPIGLSVTGFPIDDEKAQKEAGDLISRFEPKAIIAIERRGPNVKGVYHGWEGDNMNRYEAKVGHIFTEARRRGILTIGIGDACGTEIGMSKISEAVKKINPYGANCGCPCGAGIADATEVNIFVEAAVSNWGAHGIAACLSALLGKPEVFHNGEIEEVILRECASAGGVDGTTAIPRTTVDGVPGKLCYALVDMLSQLVKEGLKKQSD